MHRHCHALKIQCCISYLPFLCLQYDQNCHHHHHHCGQPYHHYLCVFIPHIKEKLSGHSVSPYPDSLSNDVLFLAPSGVLYLIPMRHYRSNTPLSQFSLSPMPQSHNSGPKLLQHHQRNSGQLTQLTNRLFRPTILTLPTSFHWKDILHHHFLPSWTWLLLPCICKWRAKENLCKIFQMVGWLTQAVWLALPGYTHP